MKNSRKVLKTQPTNGGLVSQQIAFALFGMTLFSGQVSAQQPAILSTTLASNQIVVIPNANTPGTQGVVPGLPANAQPHGVAYYGSDRALVGDGGRSRIFVVQISTATLLSTIDTTAAGYDGSGTIAVAPDQSVALALGGEFIDAFQLKVIHAPFAPDSAITIVDLPGAIYQYQTQGIVFNSAGRAFIKHSGGVSVVDPPYTAVAFSFSPTNPGSGAIAITPDGNTLMTTCACSEGINTQVVKIYTAPFSESSTPVDLLFEGSNYLDGLAIAPDGASAIVVSAAAHHAAAFTAPFSHNSPIETFTLPPGLQGFEDVSISADSQLAILTGNSTTEPAVLIRAPFTTAGAMISNMPILGVSNSNRGQGAVRFRPASAIAPLQLTAAVSRKAHGSAGDFDINLPLSAEPGVECRSTGGAYTLVITLSNNVVSGNASVTSGTGSVLGSPTFTGNTITVNLTGVANAQIVTVTLSNVTDSFYQVLPNTPVNAGFLIGDTNGDKFVNAGDALQTRNRSGQTTAITNFRSDVNLDGFLNSGDTLIVRSRSGTALP